MNRVGIFVFVTGYCLLVGYLLLAFMNLCGIAIGSDSQLIIYAGWLIICFTSCWWVTPFSLASMNVRRTVLEEEARVNSLFEEVKQRSQLPNPPRLLLLQSKTPTAFATGRRTVALSTGILALLNDDEIKAVLAHEFGHLRDRDTMMSSAYGTALIPLNQLYVQLVIRNRRLKLKLLWFALWALRIRVLFILLILLLIFIFSSFPALLWVILILHLFSKHYIRFFKMVQLIWCFFSRRKEFKQDEYAQSLGYGLHLKNALVKICPLDAEVPIERMSVIFQSHPIIADRVRRIEWLEGLRSTP